MNLVFPVESDLLLRRRQGFLKILTAVDATIKEQEAIGWTEAMLENDVSLAHTEQLALLAEIFNHAYFGEESRDGKSLLKAVESTIELIAALVVFLEKLGLTFGDLSPEKQYLALMTHLAEASEGAEATA